MHVQRREKLRGTSAKNSLKVLEPQLDNYSIQFNKNYDFFKKNLIKKSLIYKFYPYITCNPIKTKL